MGISVGPRHVLLVGVALALLGLLPAVEAGCSCDKCSSYWTNPPECGENASPQRGTCTDRWCTCKTWW